MNSKWKDCVKEPSEIGKKVLCERNGDLFVAVRIEEYYIPMPFADHYFSKDLCKPTRWCEIDFPGELTGYYRVCPKGDGTEVIKLSECREKYPEIFWDLANAMINSIGKIPMPNKENE
jgi:hypothetical protein